MPNRKEPLFDASSHPQEPEVTTAVEAIITAAPEAATRPKETTFTPVGAVVRPPAFIYQLLLGLAWFLALAALAFAGWLSQQLQQQAQHSQELLNRIQEVELRIAATDDDLMHTGNSFTEKLAWADSEIRKLWVVAHQRNRPAIETLQTQVSQLEQQLATGSANLAKYQKNLAELKTNLGSVDTALAEANRKLISQHSTTQQRLAEVSLATSTLQQSMRDQDTRAAVTKLTQQLAKLEADWHKLEAAAAEQAKQHSTDSSAQLKQQLAEQAEVLASLEASRNQLVSRVTRLMEEVRQLQQVQQ